MSLFNRFKNIIKSNIYHRDDGGINFDTNIDLDTVSEFNTKSFDDVYYDDAKDVPETNNIEREYYSILEIEYGAGFDKIKSAYRRLLKKYHPDLYQNKPEKQKTAQKLTEKINEAYNYFERKYR